MRLNLGCGHDRREGWVNVDRSAGCAPDQVVDLERLPWPWADDAVEEVLLKHVLEHLGAGTAGYLGIVRELYRVCRADARVRIVVPHPRHDSFLNDPTHVRAITPEGLELFSRRKNLEWQAAGRPNSPLALELGVDFELAAVNLVPDEPWRGQLQRGEIDWAALARAMRQYNNVILETSIELRVIKGGP